MRISDWSDVCSSDLLVHHVDHVPVARDQQPLLAIAREAHIVAVEREGGGHRDRLFAGRFHVEAGLALPLRAEHALVIRARQRHRSEEHTSELQSLMRISYAVFCLKKKKKIELNSIKQHQET